MKKFDGHKTHAQIKAQCKALNLVLKDKLWRDAGADHVLVQGGGATVFYNTFNGRFFGTTDKGVEFTSDSDRYDKEAWMQTLLDFFYINNSPKKIKQPATAVDYTLGGVKMLEKA